MEVAERGKNVPTVKEDCGGAGVHLPKGSMHESVTGVGPLVAHGGWSLS